MPSDPIGSARRFVREAVVPAPVRLRGAEPTDTPALVFDAARTQAAVVGSEVVSFVTGVTSERREAITNSSLLAQLVAKNRIQQPDKIYQWYDVYFDVLTNIGWVIQDRSFAEYHESSKNFEAHEAILAVATTLLGPTPAALAIVKTTIESLKSMKADSPWVTIFNKESQTARTARFQISLAEQNEAGQFFVSLMAFGLEAKSTITQVLFFKARANQATLRHYSGKVTINTDVLDAVGGDIKAKLTDHVRDYVRTLPI